MSFAINRLTDMDDSVFNYTLPEKVWQELCEWLNNKSRVSDSTVANGVQGSVSLFESHGMTLVVKTANGRKSGRSWLFTRLLEHEYNIYQKLKGFPSIPKCYGLIKGKYLILEYVEGNALRDNEPDDKDYFYTQLKKTIEQLHALGIGHMDLKKKDNILVYRGKEPYLIDFGVSCVKKQGFHPINRYLFCLAKQLDLNAWIKHKYNRDFDRISPEDSEYFKITKSEKLSRSVKKILKFVRKK